MHRGPLDRFWGICLTIRGSISHGDALEDAEYVRDQIRERFGMEHFMINHIGPTIGAHSGPGTIALFFMGESR